MSLDCYVSVRAHDVCIVATIDGKITGTYWLDLGREPDGNIFVTSSDGMESEVPARGIPRALIRQATETLQQIATKRNVKVIHSGGFVDSKARQKLSHIFEEYRYIRVGQEYQREYVP